MGYHFEDVFLFYSVSFKQKCLFRDTIVIYQQKNQCKTKEVDNRNFLAFVAKS